MKNRDSRTHGRRLIPRWAGILAAAMAASAAFPGAALAGSPEFAYSQEKWASLRDNVLEYGELADLVHEYNPTVINNRIAYDDYRDKDNDKYKRDYENAVQDMYSASDSALDNVDEDSPGYAGALASSVTGRIQAERMEESADSENSDGKIKKLEYDSQEAKLVQSAQTKMNQYWQKVKNRQSLDAGLELARARQQSAAVRASQGQETQAAVLEAQEAVDSAQAAIQSADQEIDTLRSQLCVLTGWSYDASPEIGEIPVVRTVDLSAIDLTADKQKALDQNLMLQAGLRRQDNTTYGTATKKTLDINMDEARQKIQADVENRWQLLKQAQANQDQAAAQLVLEQQTAQASKRKLDNGIIKRNEYLEAQNTLAIKEAAEQVSALKLTQAMEDYQWAVGGLADTGNL